MGYFEHYKIKIIFYQKESDMKSKLLIASAFGLFLSASTFANDITGKWLQIDDKTGTSKAVIEIRKDAKDC